MTPGERQERLFYAYLYLGLYHEANGAAKESLAYMRKAVDQQWTGHYMWDVARVHRDLLTKK